MGDSRDKPDTASVRADLFGRQLGDFRLLRRLGRGAMAEVYLAEQCLLRRRVAVKILRPELADDQTYLKRFEREAQAAASLVHANIVQIYEVGHVDGLHFIAQEYVQGQNLQEWITRHGPPDLPHALSIMRQVAAALTKAAEQGVVHRDIKPENIMLTQSGEVKVADFGLARVAREGEGVDLTQVGITMGTPLYMSPEQIEGKPLDPRSDLYSLGVTCYHMLAGSPPFDSETALGVAIQHLKKQPEPLENLRPDLPPALCRLVHAMLAKDPQHRCQSAREVLRQLRRLYLEQSDGDWPEDLPGWETVAAALPSDPRAKLTQQLGGLMKTVAVSSAGRRRKPALLAGLFGAFLLGGAIAWITTVESSLSADARPPAVPRQQTAWLQFVYAGRIGTEEAWQSVVDYVPRDKRIACYAEQQLARLYLLRHDYGQALAIFDKFATENEPDERLRATGLAGKCVVLTLQGKYQDSAALLAQLWPLRSNLDKQMRTLVGRAVKSIDSELKGREARDLGKWMKAAFPEDGR